MHRRALPSILSLTLASMALLVSSSAADAAQDAEIHGRVVNGFTREPIEIATVEIVETGTSVDTIADGLYRQSLAPGVYTLRVSRPGFVSVERTIVLEAGQSVSIDVVMFPEQPTLGEEVVVIGSRGERTVLETAVPVDVLDSAELDRTGQSETSRMIQFLAPSFNFSTSTISDGTDIVRPSTLRGLGPDQTLVLVNGKRRHMSALVHVNGSIGRGSAGVDLNTIPAAAIERVEILRDGAAAQYGSDAIAGVINIVLKERPQGTQVKLNLGQMYRSDGELVQASVNHGLMLGSRGFLNLTADYRNRGNTNRAGLDQRSQYLPLEGGGIDPREAGFDRLNHRYGDADSENLTLWANAEAGVGDTGTLYFFGGYSGRNGESAGFYRRALDARTRPEIHPDGFLPRINTEVDDLSASVGYRQLLGGWSVDTSLTSGSNSFEFIINNSNNVSMGPSSPTSAGAGTLNFRQTTFNFDAFTNVDWGLAHPVQLAVGAEVRRDNYQIEAGETASWVDGGFPNQFASQAAPGIQVFPGFRPGNEVDELRTNVGAYVDLETQLTDDLLLATAVRYEDYSDFGSFLSGKVAARWALSEEFALRGSVNSGFRAPSLHQAYFNNTSTQFVFSDVTDELLPFEVGTFANGSQVTNAFGVPSLREETARNVSLGFVARPASNWSLTGDVFFIGIEDRIVVSGQFQSERDADGEIRAILQPFGVNAAQFFSNAIDTETVGADLVLAWFDQIDREGSLHLTAAANWNRTRVVGDVRTPPALDGLGGTLFNRIERERIESAQPRNHYQVAARYTRPEITAVVRANRFGSVKTVESAGNPALDQVFAAKWLVDLELTHPLRPGLNVSVGANNIFHAFPDENRQEISFGGIFVYPRRTAPFGFNGGFYYTRLTYDF